MFSFFNSYAIKDDEAKQKFRIQCYMDEIINTMSALLNISHDEFRQTPAEICHLLFEYGQIGFVKFDEGYWCGGFVPTGKLDRNGRGIDGIVTFLNGTTYEGKINKDIVVLRCNVLGTSRRGMASRYAYMLSDIDLSLVYNLVYSRVCPIPIVRTDNEKRSLADVMESLFKGKLTIFKRETMSADLLGIGTSQGEQMLNLTNPATSEYLQHLNRLHDEIIIRCALEFGIHVSARDKGAQLNESELQAFNDLAAVKGQVLTNELDEFKKNMKNTFGIDVTAEVRKYIYNEVDVEEAGEEMEEGATDGNENIDGNPSGEK